MLMEPSLIRSTIVGSPSLPRPSEDLRTARASIPFRRRTEAVPEVARIVKPSSAIRAAGSTIARLSVSAIEMKTVPEVGMSVEAPSCDFAKAVGKSRSMPITSPVERISGPSTVSTASPRRVRNRLKGKTAALTAMEPPSRIVRASRVGSTPHARRDASEAPT